MSVCIHIQVFLLLDLKYLKFLFLDVYLSEQNQNATTSGDVQDKRIMQFD